MNYRIVSLRSKMYAAGLAAGLLAGCSAGCSRSNSAQVDVAQVRAALAKRRSDFGETLPRQARPKDKTPAHVR
jgi:hypothetical protein